MTNQRVSVHGMWSSRAVFVMATVGSAVGLGNVWKFPYITGEYGGFYGKYAGFSQDFDGNYFEFGYGWDFSGVDLGVSLILADDDLIGDEDETLIFTIGKSFDLD